MTCQEYQCEIARGAAVGVPTGALRSGLRQHVGSCARCAAELARMSALMAAIDSGVAATVAGEPTPALMTGLRARIAEESGRRAWFSWVPIPLAVAALAMLLLFALVGRLGLHPAPQIGQTSHTGGPAAVVTKSSVTAPVARDSVRRPAHAVTALTAPGGRGTGTAARRPSPEGLPEPEILVPRGEWTAVLTLDAAMRSGEVDGEAIVAARQAGEKPVVVDELKMVPLQVAQLSDTTETLENSSRP
jgi:hypothetical protein